jgi:hypothetical protein
MALDKTRLGADLFAMMSDAKDKAWTARQVADAMAAAIDTYVRGADVNGVRAVLPDGKVAVQSGPVHPS